VHANKKESRDTDGAGQKESVGNNYPKNQSVHKSRYHPYRIKIDKEISRVFAVDAVVISSIHEILEDFVDEYPGNDESEIPSENTHYNDKRT
jgi:hypothetical protein